MKEKTSITHSSDVLAKVDHLADSRISRPTTIERVARTLFRERALGKVRVRDLNRINAVADRLNAEAEDVLTYQL